MKEKEECECCNDYRHHHHHCHCHCHCHHRSPVSIIIRRSIGFIVFMIMLSVASFIVPNINNPVYSDVIQFFNSNIDLFLILFFIGMISDIFWNFCFPFNILAPVISSVLSIFVVAFLYKVWLFINNYVNMNVTIPISAVYIVVFILIFILGYVALITRGARRRFEERLEIKKEIKKRRGKKADWEDVREEFRLAFYNLGKAINDTFEKHEKKGRKRNKK